MGYGISPYYATRELAQEAINETNWPMMVDMSLEEVIEEGFVDIQEIDVIE